GSYDLVVTHFFLDCFDENELEQIVPKIAAILAPGGIWLVADFAIPERGPGKIWARFLIPIMYTFFGISAGLQTRRLIDPTGRLVACGLNCDPRSMSLGGIVKSDLWRMNNARLRWSIR